MSESEWSRCTDSLKMLAFLGSRAGRPKLRQLVNAKECERKQRLFLIACCRRIWHLMADNRTRCAVEVADRYVDGKSSQSELANAYAAAVDAYAAIRSTTSAAAYCAACTAAEVARPSFLHGFSICVYGAEVASMAPAARLARGAPTYHEKTRSRERAVQAEILHDLFGNPFQFKRASVNWKAMNHKKVLRSAKKIQEERAFEDLPLLADALKKAGDVDAEILNHCLSKKPHVRGCWVVDLICKKASSNGPR